MKMFRRSEGFTLVELMVVVLIIGILVAIAIPVFNAAKASSQQKSCYANQRTLEGAAQTYQGDTGSALVSGDVSGASNWLVPQYIKKSPKCPMQTSATACYNMDASGTVLGDLGNTWGTINSVTHTHYN